MNEVTDQLWISDIAAVREQSTARFDRVVTVCQDRVDDNVGCAYDYFNMADGPHSSDAYGGNYDYDTFTAAADCVAAALRADETVLVHCHAGRSRSVAVSIAALAVTADHSYWSAYDAIADARGFVHPDPILADQARQYIDAHTAP